MGFVLLPGPLHRVTQLRHDPIAGWMTGSGRMGVNIKWAAVWIGYAIFVRLVFFGAALIMDTPSLSSFNVVVMGFSFPRLAAMAASALLLLPVRHLASVVRAGATAKAGKEDASDAALALDDFQELEGQPEGRIVSVVGWVRGHGTLHHKAGGHRAVGLALPCRGQTLVETLHNFDLVDEAGQSALVVAAGARLLGRPTVQISRVDAEDRALLHSLDLPAGVVPTYWSAFVLRDGDPVMVIGARITVHDMTELQRNRPTTKTAIGSLPKLPMLVIPLDAERREV